MTETYVVYYGPCMLIGDSPAPAVHSETLRLVSQAWQVPVADRPVLRVIVTHYIAPSVVWTLTTLN